MSLPVLHLAHESPSSLRPRGRHNGLLHLVDVVRTVAQAADAGLLAGLPTRTEPAKTIVEFAAAEPGGTGRFDLVIAHPAHPEPVTVVSSLSKGQAESAARWINEALGAWLEASTGPAPVPPAAVTWTGPHSRACGTLAHPHGTPCHANCPTCGGKP